MIQGTSVENFKDAFTVTCNVIARDKQFYIKGLETCRRGEHGSDKITPDL